MSSDIISCLTAKLEAGRVSKSFVEDVKKQLEGRTGQDAVDAAQGIAKRLEGDVQLEYNRAMRFAELKSSLLNRIQNSPAESAQLVNDVKYYFHDYVELGQQARTYQYLGGLQETLERIKPDKLGRLANPEGERQILKALYNEAGQTADAQAMGVAILNTFKQINSDAAALGVSKAPKSYLPSMFLSEKLHRAGTDTFVSDILKTADSGQLFGEANKYAHLFPSREAYLKEAYNSLKHGGHAMPLMPEIKFDAYDLARNFQDLYKAGSATAWEYMNKQYGTDSLFSALVMTVQRDAKHLTLADTLGTKSNGYALARSAVQALDNKIGSKSELLRQVESAVTYHFGGYEVIRAENRATAVLQNVMGGIKNLVVSSNIPGVAVQALTSDSVFKTAAFAAKGISTDSFLGGFSADIATLAKFNENKALLGKLGLQMDHYIDYAMQAYHQANAMTGTRWTSSLAGNSVRFSGLNTKTNASRMHSQKMANAYLTEWLTASGWDEMLPKNRAWFERNGIVKTDVEFLQNAAAQYVKEVNGVKLVDLNAMQSSSEPALKQLAQKLGTAAMELQNMATPTSSTAWNKTLAQLRSVSPATAALTDSFATFMSFSQSVWAHHIAPNLHSKSGIAYVGALAAAATTAQMLYYQIYDGLTGKKPRGLTDPKDWAQAFAMSGAIPFSNYLLVGQRGGSALDFLGAPFQPFVKTYKAGKNFVEKRMDGKETQLTHDLAQVAWSLMPGRTMWYARLVLERYMMDPIIAATHPKGERRLRELNVQAQRQGQTWWWRRGAGAPGE